MLQRMRLELEIPRARGDAAAAVDEQRFMAASLAVLAKVSQSQAPQGTADSPPH